MSNNTGAIHSERNELHIADEKSRILKEIANWFERVKAQLFETGESGEGEKELAGLSGQINGNLNNLQHQALIIKAAEYLDQKLPGNKWYWNPGDMEEGTDLIAAKGETVILSAEVNAFSEADDIAQSKIWKSLAKLQRASGEKFYIVQNDALHRKAQEIMGEGVYVLKV